MCAFATGEGEEERCGERSCRLLSAVRILCSGLNGRYICSGTDALYAHGLDCVCGFYLSALPCSQLAGFPLQRLVCSLGLCSLALNSLNPAVSTLHYIGLRTLEVWINYDFRVLVYRVRSPIQQQPSHVYPALG